MKKIVNIALTYSGLIGKLDSVKTHKALAELFPSAEQVNFTAFIHTWEYKDNLLKLESFINTVHKDVCKHLKVRTSDYSALDSILIDADIQKLYLSNKAMDRYNIDRNLINVNDYSGDTKIELLRYKFAQFYSQYEALSMVSKDESSFDLVVRLRPDTSIDCIVPEFTKDNRFPMSETFEEYIHSRNQRSVPSPGIRPLGDNIPDLPIMWTAFNPGDSGVTEHGFNYADWLWFLGHADFIWFMEQFGSSGNFVTEMINSYKLQEQDEQFHGVHRFLSKSILQRNGMVYPWQAIETSLEFT